MESNQQAQAVASAQQGAKRKRSPEGVAGIPPSMQMPREQLVGGSGSREFTPINYLVRSRTERLRLIEGDVDTFGDVIGSLDDYEGVLQRHESLAANLGAKLVGPLLLKSIEKLFDGPIKIFQQSDVDQRAGPVTWLDIVAMARSDPSNFVLSTVMHGSKVCRFFIKGLGVEISEDDYRLLMSGAPERMLPSNPIPEDENAELGTLNILENRLGMLIKKADAVASKARQLNYHLKQRKTAVMARRPPEAENKEAAYSPQPFSPINTIRTIPSQNGEAGRLQQELLMQFSTAAIPDTPRRPNATGSSRPSKAKVSSAHHEGAGGGEGGEPRRVSHGPGQYDDAIDGRYRLEMAARIEKLRRGDPIYPPCDRCRRLNFDCAKHLTACTACTKKHAKCSWKDVKEAELSVPVPTPAEGSQQQGASGRQGSEGSGSNGLVMEGRESREGTQPKESMTKEEGPKGSEDGDGADVNMLGTATAEEGAEGAEGAESAEKEGERRDERDQSVEAMLTQMAGAAVAAVTVGQ